MRILILRLSILLLLLACANPKTDLEPESVDPTQTVATPNNSAHEAKPVGPPLPNDSQYVPGERFSLDMRPEDVPFVVMGSTQHRVLARLSNPNGRRTLYVADGHAQGSDELALSEDWYANVVSAMHSNGELAVCATKLLGTPTQLTEGEMPDPRHGMSLVCARRVDAVWQDPVDLAPKTGAYLVVGMLAAPEGGFVVQVLYDTTGLIMMPARASDGWFSVPFRNGQLGEPQLIKRLELDLP